MKYTKKIICLAILLISLGVSNVYATKGLVMSDGVRIRTEPNTNSKIVNTLNKSATVEILSETDGWYKIKYTENGNYEGYMSKDFVKAEGTVATTEPTNQPTDETTPTPEATPTPTTVAPETPASEEPKVSLLGEKIISAEAKVYILPVITSSVKDTVSRNVEVSVQEIAGNFAYIKYNNKFGWIRIDFLQEKKVDNNQASTTNKEKKGYINVTQAIVRKKATTSSEMVTSLNFNSEVTIIGEESDFYKVRINNQECYIAKRLISDTKQQTTSRASVQREETATNVTTKENKTEQPATKSTPVSTPTPATTPTPVLAQTNKTSDVGQKMAQMAKSYVGYKYVYGGATPASGFDCSGLVYYICNQLGYKVNRTADAQVNNGVKVEKANLQPGDLVFFTNYKTNTGIGHVGIYIGNNQFVHASTPSVGVIISSLNSAEYTRRYVTARRIGI